MHLSLLNEVRLGTHQAKRSSVRRYGYKASSNPPAMFSRRAKVDSEEN